MTSRYLTDETPDAAENFDEADLVECSACEGLGYSEAWGTYETCVVCDGTGKLSVLE